MSSHNKPAALSICHLFSTLLIVSFFVFGAAGLFASTTQSPEDIIKEAQAKTAVAEAQAAASNARKAAIEAELAELNVKMGGISAAEFTGATKVNQGAGQTEAMLLGSVAVNKVASVFADSIRSALPGRSKTEPVTLLLFSSANAPQFTAVNVFNAQYEFFKSSKVNLDRLPKGTSKARSQSSSGGRSALLPAVGLGLEGISNLLSYAKTDYEFNDVSIASDDQMLMSALSKYLKPQWKDSSGIHVEIPEIYQRYKIDDSTLILDKISHLYTWSSEAKKTLGMLDPKNSKELYDKWADFAKAIDAWLARESMTDEKGRSPLGEVLYQATILQKLDKPNAFFAVVKLNKLGGTTYTKKNLWSSLGANPFHVMGSAVASYTVFEGASGIVCSSMLLPLHGGYYSISDIKKFVNDEKSSVNVYTEFQQLPY